MFDFVSRRRPIFQGLLLVLLTALVFHNVLQAGFVRWDDGMHVYANPYLHPVSLSHLARLWSASYQNLYVPVSYSVYALLVTIAHLPAPVSTQDGLWIDLDPRVFHGASLLLHLANVLLVFALLRRLLPGPSTAGNDWAAAAGALLFAVHPVQVEAVAWIAELRGLLSALFLLLALHAYLRYTAAPTVEEPNPPAPFFNREGPPLGFIGGAAGLGSSRARGQWRWFGLATLCFALALLSKPSAIVLPLVVIVLETLILRRPVRAWRSGIASWGVLCLGVLFLTHAAQPVTEDIVTPLWTRPFVAGDALAFYLGKLLWPTRLGIDYGRSPVWLVTQKWFVLHSLLPFSLCLAVWIGRRRAPWLLAAFALFAAALLPTLGLTPFVFQVYSTVADRYLYLALLGPALGLAWGLTLLSRTALPRAQVTAWCGCAAFLLLLSVASRTQTRCWQNSIPLFQQAILVNPQSWGTYNNLGAVALDRGQPEDALPLLTEAVRLRPAYAEAHANRGVALLEIGAQGEAEAEFRTATSLKPDYARAYAGLGDSLLAQGQSAAAAAAFRQALALNPNSPRARQALQVAERGAMASP